MAASAAIHRATVVTVVHRASLFAMHVIEGMRQAILAIDHDPQNCIFLARHRCADFLDISRHLTQELVLLYFNKTIMRACSVDQANCVAVILKNGVASACVQTFAAVPPHESMSATQWHRVPRTDEHISIFYAHSQHTLRVT